MVLNNSSSVRIPVTLVTGFLGSGKTTLLKHILTDNHNLKIAVLVNEFGKINIDSQLLLSVDEEMVLLSNGCICCTINQSLIEAINQILTKQDIDYIIIEPSGLAEPLPLMMTFLSEPLCQKIRLDSIITLVDAENFEPEDLDKAIALSQIIYGDIILLNKTDLVTSDKIDKIEYYINSVKNQAIIWRCQQAKVPLSLILALDLSHKLQLNSHQYSLNEFMSFSWQSDRPLNVAKFANFINELPKMVFRGKGILWYEGSQLRHIFQLSGKRQDWQTDNWKTPPCNQLVLIGKNLDNEKLEQQLQNCLRFDGAP